MSEDTFYLKARFDSAADLQEKLPAIEAFITEGIHACDYWQVYRSEPQEEFWSAFTKRFPLVTKYLGDFVGGDCNNALSGLLEFGWGEAAAWDLRTDGAVLSYSADAWAHGTWENFALFLETHFGAKRTGWLKGGEVNPLDAVSI